MAIIKVDNIVRLEEINDIKKSIEDINKQIEDDSKRLEAAKAKAEVDEAQATKELGEITKIRHLIIDLESQIKSLELTDKDLKERRAAMEVRAKDLAESHNAKEDEKSKKQDELTTAEKEVKEAEEKLKKIEEEHGTEHEDYIAQEAVVEAAKITILKHKAALVSIEKDLETIELMKQRNDDDRDEISDRMAKNQTDLEDKSVELKDLKEHLSTLEEKHEKLADDLQAARDEIKSIEKDAEENADQLKAQQVKLEEKEETRASWNTSFEATALDNYVEDMGDLSSEAKESLASKQKFNQEVANALGIRGSDENTKLSNTLGEIKETPELKDAVHTLTATAAKVMSDMQNYTMASLVKKIEAAAMKGQIQIKLETTLTKGIINHLFEAGYDIHFETEGNNYVTIINWAHPNMTNPAGSA